MEEFVNNYKSKLDAKTNAEVKIIKFISKHQSALLKLAADLNTKRFTN